MDRLFSMKYVDFMVWFNKQVAFQTDQNVPLSEQFCYEISGKAKMLKSLPGKYNRNYHIHFKNNTIAEAIDMVNELKPKI